MSDPTLNQDEIDALLSGFSGGGDAAPPEQPDITASPPSQDTATDFDISSLMGDTVAAPSVEALPQAVMEYAPAVSPAMPQVAYSNKNIEVLLDIPLQVVAELGRVEMQIKDILDLCPGSVVELNKLAGEPINVLVNGKLVAKGEVVVVEENFGIRLVQIISPMERLSQLQ